MRFQNAKILLRWPSRIHIYGLVENRTFLNMMEQSDSMGVPSHFTYALETKVWNLFGGTTS